MQGELFAVIDQKVTDMINTRLRIGIDPIDLELLKAKQAIEKTSGQKSAQYGKVSDFLRSKGNYNDVTEESYSYYTESDDGEYSVIESNEAPKFGK